MFVNQYAKIPTDIRLMKVDITRSCSRIFHRGESKDHSAKQMSARVMKSAPTRARLDDGSEEETRSKRRVWHERSQWHTYSTGGKQANIPLSLVS